MSDRVDLPEAPIPHPGRLCRIVDLALAIPVFLVAGWTMLPLLDLSLLGWDAWPAIAGSVRGELLSSTFMDGLHPKAGFYRPLTAASLALDHALYGTNATGYQATSILLHAATTLALYVAARRLWGSAFAGFVAVAVYLTHPLHLEVLPYPARRGEVLALLFGMSAIAWGWQRRADAWLGVALVAAIAAKETGLVFTVALASHFLLNAGRRRRFITHALIPVGAFLALRWLALLGAGGYEGVAPRHAPRGEFASEFAEFLLFGGRDSIWYATSTCVLAVLAWIWARLQGTATNDARFDRVVMYGAGAPSSSRREVWIVLGTGLAATLGVHLLLAPVMSSWYPLHATAFIAGLVGAAARPRPSTPPPAETTSRVPETYTPMSERSAHWNRAGAAIAVTIGGWVITLAFYGFLSKSIGQSRSPEDLAVLREASDWNDSYLAAAEEALREAPPGAVIDLRPSACLYDPGADQPGRVTASSQRRVVMLFAPYSLEAWALVALPDVPVHVRHPNEARPRDLDPATRTLLFRQPWEDAAPVFDADGRVETTAERVR